MCGIAGLIVVDKIAIDLTEAASRMMGALEHRGPDSFGYHVDERESMVFVHRRLAIQDLTEAGKQPMFCGQQRYLVVFNGEIYNFKILAKKLEALGHTFSGRSDTEVLLAAIVEWGLKSALQRFIGMFAFALWDTQEKILYLCRDRLGEKPLYYGWVGNNFYFSSELKAIECVVPKSKLEIDPQALAGFFKYGYINAPKSIYKGLSKLMPGTYLAIGKNSLRDRGHFSPNTEETAFSPSPYWSLLEAANAGLKNPFKHEQEAIEEVDSVLHRTVAMQTIADVGVGTFLSGGIDSSLVSAVAQSESNRKVKTFTIGFEEAEYDESKYAERIAKHLGTDHQTVYMSAQNALEVVPKLHQIYDEPFADSSQIPTYLVSKIARKDVTVCLSGDGGDELFAGYNRYISSESIWKKTQEIPLPLRKALAAVLQQPKPEFWDRCYRLFAPKTKKNGMEAQRMVGLKLQKLSTFITQASLEEGYQYLSSYWDRPEQLLAKSDTIANTMRHYHRPETEAFIEQAMYWDQMNYLPGDNLAKVDRASMAVSLETRLPLLSHEMAELSWRIPKTMKVRNGESKWILKQVLDKYMPRDLVVRPKMGFSVPVAQWLRKELHEWASDLLVSDNLKNSGMLNHKLINKVWNQHINGDNDHSLKLWAVLMYLSWSDQR